MKKQIAFLLISFIVSYLSAQETRFFKDGDRVCFVGNSITHSGEFHHNISLFQVTRFPNQQVSFFNCGVAGDVTQGILNRMDDDILIHNPTQVVIMIGMNDVQRWLYSAKPSFNADTLRLRQEAIAKYKVNLEKIVQFFLSKDIKVILQKPSIYDQTATIATANNLGVNDALKACADFIEILAQQYKLPIVDYWTLMNNLNLDIQKQNPKATIIGNDRVHPGSVGHLIMAYQFLKSTGMPAVVSYIDIEKDSKTSNKRSKNCEISSLKNDSKNWSFSVKENALPFPMVAAQMDALKLIPFNTALNQEILKLPMLQSGKYNLLIDGQLIGYFPDSVLKKGINLAEFPATAQYKQAIKVRDILSELWSYEARLRSIKFIEYNQFYKDCPYKADVSKSYQYMDSVLTAKKVASLPYYKAQLLNFRENKPIEKQCWNAIDSLRTCAYQTGKPVTHQFSVELQKR